MLALVLKELEFRQVTTLHREVPLGIASGVIRRIASDLCLWLSSSCTTLLSLMGIAVYEEFRLQDISEPERSIVLRILMTLGLLVLRALLGHFLLKSDRSLIWTNRQRPRSGVLVLGAIALGALIYALLS